MNLHLAYISPRRERLKSGHAQALAEEYAGRAHRYAPTVLQAYRSEGELLAAAERRAGRGRPFLILLDSRGQTLASAQFAEMLRTQRDSGTRELTLAIGPADGWSPAARTQAGLLLSIGAFTLPHELALVLLAEQSYRALTILAGHPYHCGHE